MTQFRLRRVSLQPLIDAFYYEENDHERWPHLNGDVPWLANVPNVFQALADPEGTHDFAQAPQWGEGVHPSAAYWESLLFLLVHSFGWRSPALGLKWWHDAGRPCDDDRLALIDQTWFSDGFMRWFEAWVQHWEFGPRNDFEPPLDSHLLVPKLEEQHLERLSESLRLTLPLWGGWDPLHLTTHVWDNGRHHELILDSDGDPRGVLFTESVVSFRAFLHGAAALRHEHPSGRSWRIDVICKQIGWLGTYRRSRVTGYWFAGKHSIHRAGHPNQQTP